MKLRTCRFSLFFAFVFAVCSFAQGEHGDTTGSHGGGDGGSRDRGGKGREHSKEYKQKSGCGSMIGCLSVAHTRIIPTNDGGVVVAIGNKLIKFDRNMRPKEEVVIEMSREEVQMSIQRMKDIMDMCKEMMPRGQGMENTMYDNCCDEELY
ncbi:MAG: hypothetical protein LBI42_05320 [Chitinispirillales bacterium]|jgi:hypothetical protein|nr:hypothetical protein [Chitinispirillales bacterium]